MTEGQMREVVSAAFVSGWTTAQPSIPLALENEALPSADSFVMLTIVTSNSQQATMGRTGTRRVKRQGYVQLKLWGPKDQGVAGITALADAAQGILEMKSLPSPLAEDDPVTFLASQNGGNTTDGRWFMILTRLPFWYSETR